jgi:hypothetical protein
MLTSFIDAGFNAGACDEENKVDVLKIFSEQSKNPAHLESNRALIKKLIQTAKVKGYDNPEQAETLSDMAQRIIQGIDDETLILTSTAQEEDRKNPQFVFKTNESICRFIVFVKSFKTSSCKPSKALSLSNSFSNFG